MTFLEATLIIQSCPNPVKRATGMVRIRKEDRIPPFIPLGQSRLRRHRSVKLSQLKPVQKGSIRKISATGPLRRRLMDMGLTIGTSVVVVRTAPLGDPIEVSVRGYDLSLRKVEADLIEVELEA